VKEARFVVPYDALNRGAWHLYGCYNDPYCMPRRVRHWVATATANGLTPFLVLGPSEHNHYAPAVSGGPNSFASSFENFVNYFKNVHEWAADNEPDRHGNPTQHNPRLAARYLMEARAVLHALHRPDTLVAGEFSAINATSVAPGGFFWLYNNELQRADYNPAIWSLHAYKDVMDRTTTETQLLLAAISPQSKVDLTEEGVILHGVRGLDGHPKLQRAAAADILRLSRLSTQINIVYYYQALPPYGGWDTSLVDHLGRYRPAFCVLVSWPANYCTGSSIARVASVSHKKSSHRRLTLVAHRAVFIPPAQPSRRLGREHASAPRVGHVIGAGR
jgi:hypothetical protein